MAVFQIGIFMLIALRMGTLRMASAFFLTATISLTGLFLGYNPPPAEELVRRIIGTELYIVIFGVIFYIITAISEERDTAITRLKKNADELEAALQRISSDSQAKSDFIAILAHELRNPLAPVVSYLELIKMMKLNNPEALNSVRVIDRHVKNISRILDDLLDISRISQRKFRLKREAVNLTDAVNNSIESVDSRLKATQLQISAVMPPDTLMVKADMVRLEQIFINLLTNAIKYTRPGGRIHVTCARQDYTVSIGVRDTGIGISPDMLSKIFEPFTQARDRQAFGGLGIGLYLSRKLTELHGGTLEAYSEGLGHGSEFTVTLPLLSLSKHANGMDEIEEFSYGLEEGADAQNRKILIVDDNVAAAEGLGKIFESMGHHIRLAFDGETGLKSVEASMPDLIVLDIKLPDMSGYEVVKKIREQVSTPVVVVALTGYGQEEDKIKAQKAGFDIHFTKPIGTRDIQNILRMIKGGISRGF